MQEKTILVPEITEITNFNILAKKLCPICETWHKNKIRKCMFCQKHNFKKKNTLVLSFKPLLLKTNLEKISIINYFSILSNKFKNIFFNSYNINFYINFSNQTNNEIELQYFDIFLEDVYKILNLKSIKLCDFKNKFTTAFDLFFKNRKRPTDKRILLPLFKCGIQRRKIINSNIENFV